ncbi:MFS transporter [Microbacterium lacus]|uniref:Major facilitator superfamily (MFS) profile domain-containing protein n=1 Tax=Microbacterium lacus TaxID=415217 RepID=A0ABP4T4G5_9MICO
MTRSSDIIRTLPFWMIFSVSALGGISNSASTPTIPVFVAADLGGGPELSGLLIALSAVTSIVAMPLGGHLADRFGYRVVAMSGIALSAAALTLLAAVPHLWAAVSSRLLFGLGNAAAMALTLTWLVALSPNTQRGRALSIYGLSVWLGLAAGPQLAAGISAVAEPRAVFAACVGIEIAVLILFSLLPQPAHPSPSTATSPIPTVAPRGAGAVWEVLRVVWVPGVAAAAAWCGEGLMLAFLIVHLGSAGVPATGLLGAASVFGVFAASVVVARLVLARLPDRIGPLRAAAISLVLLCGGLVILGIAGSFAVAAVGAALMGVGFSPLYPSLTMLAARGLRSRNRALGLGLFASFTSLGYASGALVGGIVLAAMSSTWAFLLVGMLQLVALAVLTVFTPDPSPRPRVSPGEGGEPSP